MYLIRFRPRRSLILPFQLQEPTVLTKKLFTACAFFLVKEMMWFYCLVVVSIIPNITQASQPRFILLRLMWDNVFMMFLCKSPSEQLFELLRKSLQGSCWFEAKVNVDKIRYLHTPGSSFQYVNSMEMLRIRTWKGEMSRWRWCWIYLYKWKCKKHVSPLEYVCRSNARSTFLTDCMFEGSVE